MINGSESLLEELKIRKSIIADGAKAFKNIIFVISMVYGFSLVISNTHIGNKNKNINKINGTYIHLVVHSSFRKYLHASLHVLNTQIFVHVTDLTNGQLDENPPDVLYLCFRPVPGKTKSRFSSSSISF